MPLRQHADLLLRSVTATQVTNVGGLTAGKWQLEWWAVTRLVILATLRFIRQAMHTLHSPLSEKSAQVTYSVRPKYVPP